MQRRTRNRLCIWVIFLGLMNYLGYGFSYQYIAGDARNGDIVETTGEDGVTHYQYRVRGHHITQGPEGSFTEVSRRTWIYSYIHSITIWPTHAAILVSMFILARADIIATMKEDSWLQGGTFVTVCVTIIVLLAGSSTLWFLLDFVKKLHEIEAGSPAVG